MKPLRIILFACFLVAASADAQCSSQALDLAQQQLSKTIQYIDTSHFPEATVVSNGDSRWNSNSNTIWGSGFFPGWIWYMYEQTLDPSLLARAQQQTASMSSEITDASTHDVGFRIMSSYGNGYAVTRDASYMNAIQSAAQTMSTLYVAFPDGSGAFNSWPYYSSTYTNTIIDNMMSIELMFYAAQNGGNPEWYTMAFNHAMKTMNNQIRADGSTYQGVEYNSDGSVHNFFTSDGYSTNSTWSRGQAWAIYGFTMAYRYTHNAQFLATAAKLANYFIANLPADYVPYWDFSQTNYRDSSAAAIAAAGLIELSTYFTGTTQANYYNAAMNIQNSLGSSYYLGSPLNTDGILLHGTYSVPVGYYIDTSLIWGDYYFIQGCDRAMPAPAQIAWVEAGNVLNNQVPLSWEGLSGAIRYSVKRSTRSGGPYAYIAPPPVLTTSSYTDTSAAPGTTYYYVVSASNANGEGPNSPELVVTTPATAPDFSVSASPPSISLSQSGSANSMVEIAALSGFNGSVNLGAINTSGLSITFQPATIHGSGSSVMTATAAGVPAGTYTITVNGSSGTLSHSIPLTIAVTPGGSFALNASPSSLSVSKSSNRAAIAAITANGVQGFSGSVRLTVEDVPRGVTAAINTSTVTPGGPAAQLMVGAGRRALAGSYSMMIVGASNGVPAFRLTVQLTITN